MKKVFFMMALVAGVLVATAGLQGCGDGAGSGDRNKGGGTVVADKSGPEYTSKYICPMHCDGSGAAEAGDCPVCGMDYVKNPDHPENTAMPSHDHGGVKHAHDGGDVDHAHDEAADHSHEDGDDHSHDGGDGHSH